MRQEILEKNQCNITHHHYCHIAIQSELLIGSQLIPTNIITTGPLNPQHHAKRHVGVCMESACSMLLAVAETIVYVMKLPRGFNPPFKGLRHSS